MPKYVSYITLFLFLVLAGLAAPMTASLVRVQSSWVSAISKLRQTNEEQAPRIVAEDRSLRELQAAVTQVSNGWNQVWNDVPTAPLLQNANLNVRIGTNQGVVEGMTLHAFKPSAEGYIYVGPFIAGPGSVRNDSATLVPGWALVQLAPYNGSSYEVSTWGGQANWRFRSLIPAGDKVQFESTITRYQTNLQTLADTAATIKTQEKLKTGAEEQLEQREGELIGLNNPEVADDPLRPELTKGLVAAISGEEEARNVLELDISELRNAILDVKAEIEAVEAQLSTTTGAKSVPARLGSRPR